MRQIHKTNAALCELYRSLVKKTELSNTAKPPIFQMVFLLFLTDSHESLVVTKTVLSQVHAADMGFLEFMV